MNTTKRTAEAEAADIGSRMAELIADPVRAQTAFDTARAFINQSIAITSRAPQSLRNRVAGTRVGASLDVGLSSLRDAVALMMLGLSTAKSLGVTEALSRDDAAPQPRR